MKVLFKHENGFFINERIFCEVYCIPENESYDELLTQGWLPSMEENGIWYQSRSCRICLDNFQISKKRNSVINKLQVSILNNCNDKLIDKFFKKYYENMGYDIFDLYNNCSDFFNPKILTIHYNNKLVGVARYIENIDSNLFLNLSYDLTLDKLSLGTNMFYILSNITKEQNKKYLYIYESYNDTFSYKLKLPNVEIWNGRQWEV